MKAGWAAGLQSRGGGVGGKGLGGRGLKTVQGSYGNLPALCPLAILNHQGLD